MSRRFKERPTRMTSRTTLSIVLAILLATLVGAQTGNDKQFAKDGLTFDYPAGWALQDDSNADAQQLSLAKANADVQIRVFVHKGRITQEKFADAKKSFI